MPVNRLNPPDWCDESGDFNIVMLIKGEERFVFVYDDDSRAACLATLGRFASNPDLNFSWFDAAFLSSKVNGNT